MSYRVPDPAKPGIKNSLTAEETEHAEERKTSAYFNLISDTSVISVVRLLISYRSCFPRDYYTLTPSPIQFSPSQSFLILNATGLFVVSGGMETSLSAEYSDFRKVGGTMFPFMVTNYAGGRRIAATVMNTYRINPPVPDSLFAP
jgi:hypothetical protein